MKLPIEDGSSLATPQIAQSGSGPRRHSLRPWISKFLWASAIALAATIVIDTRDSRDQSFTIRNTLRAFNRRWANPVILRIAGTPPLKVARLDHRGRRSGEHRSTPLWAERVSGGFLIPMPYGTDVDWAKNLIHATEGVLTYQGARYRVSSPRIRPAAVALPELPALTHIFVRLSGVRHVMHVDVLRTFATGTRYPV